MKRNRSANRRKVTRCFLLVLVLLLTLSLSGCGISGESGSEKHNAEPPVVNPVNLSMEISVELEDAQKDGFEGSGPQGFIAEEGSTVLEATELYCLSNDISISIDSDKSYVTEISGLTEKDYADTTGWIFKVNGEIPTVPADQITIAENDEIRWEFVDFATYSW